VTNNVHVQSIDNNIELQAEHSRELSTEELEMVSAGFSWGDIANIVNRVAPPLLSLL
jgi:hypothetical protein